jgi:uncharacterized protein YaaW (UPF0174 family)
MNKYSGSSFDDFLREEGIFEEVSERARKRLLALQIEDMMADSLNENVEDMLEEILSPENMNASNHHLFHPNNGSITLELLERLGQMMRQPNHHLFHPDNRAITLESLDYLASEVN